MSARQFNYALKHVKDAQAYVWSLVDQEKTSMDVISLLDEAATMLEQDRDLT